MEFKIGEAYHAVIGVGNPYKIHICALVDEMVVYKYFGRHKQWWHYGIEHNEILAIKIERAKTGE